jgi:hypothetical protein
LLDADDMIPWRADAAPPLLSLLLFSFVTSRLPPEEEDEEDDDDDDTGARFGVKSFCSLVMANFAASVPFFFFLFEFLSSISGDPDTVDDDDVELQLLLLLLLLGTNPGVALVVGVDGVVGSILALLSSLGSSKIFDKSSDRDVMVRDETEMEPILLVPCDFRERCDVELGSSFLREAAAARRPPFLALLMTLHFKKFFLQMKSLFSMMKPLKKLN